MIWLGAVLVYGYAVVLARSFSSTVQVLPSLEDVDFERVRTDHALHAAANNSEDEFPTVTLHRQLSGEGYHRTLHTSVELKEESADGSFDSSVLLLVENITRDMYIDLDEVFSLSRGMSDELVAFNDGPQFLFSAHVDVEKPASLSADHVALIYSRLNKNRMEVKLPVYFRYQSPSSNQSYRSVVVPRPLVLISHPLGLASLPCHPNTRDTCPWALLEEVSGDAETDELEIPCGHLYGYSPYLVVAITLAFSLVSLCILLYSMYQVET